jgi:peroxiredoxin
VAICNRHLFNSGFINPRNLKNKEMKQILTVLLFFTTTNILAQTDKREYAYYKQTNHFLDNIDFSDKRLLNTSILEQKMGFYFRQMVPPVVDSIKVRVYEVIGKTKANKEVYTWAVRYLYQLYRESPVPGNNEVYNFIGEKFILSEPKRWNDAAFVEKVRERVAKAKLNPIGSPATNLKLETPEGKLMDLNSVVAAKTILLFFNPDCEACHAVTEKLFKVYQQYKSKGIQVFAVYTDRNKAEWQNYISAKGLDWINVYDHTGQEGVEQKYDIYAIPMIYVLDPDKKVIAKDVPVEKLDDYLQER